MGISRRLCRRRREGAPTNLHRLRIFHTLATTGSFTGAARRLGISQPAVTIQLRELEDASGVRLLERGGRRLQLTPAGRALLRVSEPLFALVDEAETVLARAGGAVAGTLRIAASGTAGAYLLPPLLTAFRVRHPRVRIVLETSNSQRVLEQVVGFQADLGVFAAPDGAAPFAAAEPRLVIQPFAREPLLLAVPPAHPWARRTAIGVGDLAGTPLVLREPGSTTRRVLEAQLERAGVVPVVAMELGSNEAIKHAVAAGLGVAVVGAHVVAREVAGRRLRAVRLRGRGFALRFHVCYHRDRRHAPVLSAFLTLARSRARGRRPPA
jgi:LysR family transcriptional regulator, low CO2-responsive transcriptional regulator